MTNIIVVMTSINIMIIVMTNRPIPSSWPIDQHNHQRHTHPSMWRKRRMSPNVESSYSQVQLQGRYHTKAVVQLYNDTQVIRRLIQRYTYTEKDLTANTVTHKLQAIIQSKIARWQAKLQNYASILVATLLKYLARIRPRNSCILYPVLWYHTSQWYTPYFLCS